MSTSSSPPELKWNRFDALVALAVVLLAVVSALCFYLPKNQSGSLTVVIDISGQEVRRVPLSDFTEATVTSRGYTLHIAAEGGAVSVTDSDCPTRDCVHTGAISRAGQSIVCLPAQVVVHLEGASVPDTPDVIDQPTAPRSVPEGQGPHPGPDEAARRHPGPQIDQLIPFIKKSVWLMSILILLPVAWAASFASENTVWIVSAFTPFLALLLIAESTKSAIYGMNELEMSARFSLKSVVLARLIILGVFNFGIFCIIIPVCHVANSISFMQTGVYLFVPYLLTTSISLYLVRRFRNKEVIYGCMAVAVFVSGVNMTLRYMADFLFQTN